MRYVPFSTLLGKTIVEITGLEAQSDSVIFATSDGKRYKMHHNQDCCESVDIESVVGDIADLIGESLLVAEEVEGETPADYNFGDYEPDSYTWTFYKLATRKGYVDIRWLGASNGYYSESVHFEEIEA